MFANNDALFSLAHCLWLLQNVLTLQWAGICWKHNHTAQLPYSTTEKNVVPGGLLSQHCSTLDCGEGTAATPLLESVFLVGRRI